MLEFDIGFIPETPAEKYENAKLEVIALMDDPAWFWLRSQINAQRLSWIEIFNIVAANS